MTKNYIYNLTILERHLDTFGHVNNATYLEIFEEARWDLLEQNGFGHDYILKEKIGPVVLDLAIAYKKELGNREEIRIETTYVGKKNSLVSTFRQMMYKVKGHELVCEMTLSFGIMDLVKRKLVVPTSEWLKAVGAN